MTLTSIKIGVLPYDDGSGHAFEVCLDAQGVWIRQGSDKLWLKNRAECRAVMDAIDKAWEAHDSTVNG